MFSWFTCNFLLVCVFLVSSLLPMSSGSVLRSRPGCLVICDDNMRLFSFCRGIKLFSRTTKPSTVPTSVFGAFIWCFSNSCCICCFLSLFHWKVRGLDQADLVHLAFQTKFRALYSHHERCKLRPPCCQWLSVLNHVLFFIREKTHDKKYLVSFSVQRYYTSYKTLKCNHKTSHKIKYAVDVV